MLEMLEADDDVSDLDAGVIDVVLHIDCFSGGAHRYDGAERRRGKCPCLFVMSCMTTAQPARADDVATLAG